MSRVESFLAPCLADVRKLTDVSFGSQTAELLLKILANPLLSDGVDCGNFIRDDKDATAVFQAAILRRILFEGCERPALYGAMLCALPDVDPMLIGDVVLASVASRGGARFYFANTACRATLRLNKLAGKIYTGPDSCASQRLQPIHWMRFAWYMFVHTLFHRPNLGGRKLKAPLKPFSRRFKGDEVRYMPKIDEKEWSAFWREYRAGVKGLVSSRSFEEIQWAFKGDRWYTLGYYRGNKLAGSIVLKSGDEYGNRWSIADWIALDNDERILEDLLIAAKSFLRKMTKAFLFQTTGFPTFVQPILSRHFKYSRPLDSNEFIYRFDDAALQAKVMPKMDCRESWFFGPYDGDACLF